MFQFAVCLRDGGNWFSCLLIGNTDVSAWTDRSIAVMVVVVVTSVRIRIGGSVASLRDGIMDLFSVLCQGVEIYRVVCNRAA